MFFRRLFNLLQILRQFRITYYIFQNNYNKFFIQIFRMFLDQAKFLE